MVSEVVDPSMASYLTIAIECTSSSSTIRNYFLFFSKFNLKRVKIDKAF